MIRERESIWPQVLIFLTRRLPCVLALMFALFSAAPSFLWLGAETAMPWLTLMMVFYWAVYRPDLLPAWFVFFIGIVQDVVYGIPFGIFALLYTSTYWVAFTQRRLLLSSIFPVVWSAFSLIVLTVTAAYWIAGSIAYTSVQPGVPYLLRAASTILLFPVFFKVFEKGHEIFAMWALNISYNKSSVN